MRIVADEKAPGMSATALATFARDLAAFGSRADKHARDPAGSQRARVSNLGAPMNSSPCRASLEPRAVWAGDSARSAGRRCRVLFRIAAGPGCR